MDIDIHLCRALQAKCSDNATGIDAGDDKSFDDYIEQEFVKLIQVDSDVGRSARRLLRRYPIIGKPQDAVHVASALIENVHKLHTFDRQDLQSLDRTLKCVDGTPLLIRPPPPSPDPLVGTMFEGMADETKEEKTG